MTRKLSTYYADHSSSYCEIHMNFKEEMLYINYFDDTGKQFFSEDYPNKSLRYVEDAAENWALGIKQLA